jgi:cytochrome b561
VSSARRDISLNGQHFVVAAACAWLILTSPWVSMLRRVPTSAGFFDYAHVGLGFVTLFLAVTYTVSCTREGGWRLYFPWLSGGLGAVGRDVSGLMRGAIPSAEGGGLYAMIEGLLLVALAVTAVTGAAWFALQGADAALAWRAGHVLAARSLAVLIVLHLLAVASHLLDLLG